MNDPEHPRIFANDRGVWREDQPGQPFGIEWVEICRITGYKLDCVTEVDTVLEIDFPHGHFIELNSTWDGFAAVIEAMKTKISDLDPTRFDLLTESTHEDEPVSIWEKPQTSS